MRSSGIGYYQPLTGGDATANALGAFGKTMSDLGQLSLDDKKAKNEEALQNARLTLAQNADKRGDEELKLKADEVSGKNQYYASKEAREQAKLVQEALDKKIWLAHFVLYTQKLLQTLVMKSLWHGEKTSIRFFQKM